jgi:PAS domain S-box-containing protein
MAEIKEKTGHGINLSISEIELKYAEEVSEFAENIINTVREPLLVLDKDLRVIKASRSFYNFFKVTSSEIIGSPIYELGNLEWKKPGLREQLETILPEKTSFDNYEVEQDFNSIGNRIMLLNGRQVKSAFGKEKAILLAFEDITERKHKENSLKEVNRINNEYLEILFNQANVPIIIWNSSFLITRINKAFEILCGYKGEELVDKKIDILFPEENIYSILELIKKTLSIKKFEVIEINILTKNKEIKTVLWNSANIFDKEGVSIAATIAQDITKRKKIEETLCMLETRYRRLFETAKDGIIILDAETGKIVDVNPFLVDLLGYSREIIVGKNIWEIGFFKDVAANIDKFYELRQKEYVRYENLPLETADGRKINVEFVSNVYLVNNKKVIQCNIRDITERKRSEKELKVAKEKAEESDKLKSEFLAQMSHEIRTPLTSIVGNAGYLNELFKEEMDSDTGECFESIERASKRIIRTVDMILNASELQTNNYKAKFEKFDLNSEILTKLYDEYRPLAEQNGLKITYTCKIKETSIVADEYSVKQIFANLIDNAIKYTKKGKVDIQLAKNITGNIIAGIRDTGIGISNEFLPKIFKPFSQEEQGYTRSYDGNGIGLALVKKYCDLNNMKINVNSKKNMGTVFNIIFNNNTPVLKF